ncbi:MAG: SulP family inorganic anion transporter [Methylocystis sp.]|uniref:SulP family inorganic anion transporter n=1 Tax=Methylocystis sp. TaxID=1911079 RepID=UPI003959A18F
MFRRHFDYYYRYLDHDLPAGVVVFLVAVPLCLGIAVASGAPPFSGIIAGMIGGLVISILSGSQLSVSGPAAGLTVIVAAAVDKLGFDAMLLAVALSGLMQLAMGFLRAGVIGAFFPSAVIKGMLAAIGLILIMKQLPHAVGYDADAEADLSFLEDDSHTHLSFLWDALSAFSTGAVIVSLVSVAILLLWETPVIKQRRVLSLAPGPLVAVLFGVLYNVVAQTLFPSLAIASQHLVSLPAIFGPMDFARELSFPDFARLIDIQIYVTAATLALVGSLETLLSLEAVDKLDPLKRTAPTNRELKAQGVGNFLSGVLGGLPITAVIVRSSANIDAGAHTKAASFVHGLLLLLSAMFLSSLLNMIPLACLAAVLILTGYKLAKPTLFMQQYEKGFNQFAPFAVTVGAILLTDLLKGMAIGMAVGLFFVLRANYHSAFTLTRDGRNYLLRLQKDVSFLNKAQLRSLLENIENNSYLVIDGTRANFIDQDIMETIQDFIKAASDYDIRVELKEMRGLEPVNGLVPAQ